MMLELIEIIGAGATRACYLHPKNKEKCVKVLKNQKHNNILKQEIQNYAYVRPFLDDYIASCDDVLVETNKGLGIVCELIKDENGELSKPILYYRKQGIDASLKTQLDFFVYKLLEHDLFFFDFNLNNFVVQLNNNGKKLKYIDLKSFERNKSWTFLKLEYLIPQLARKIMRRRLKRLYSSLALSADF